VSTNFLSIVVPAYNEAAVLPAFVQAVAENLNLEELSVDYELLIVNDGSQDDTERVVTELRISNPRIAFIDLSRHFGKESALAAGLTTAVGDCVIFMDADLQHPAQLLPQMIAAWREGFDVVNAVKRRRSSKARVHRFLAGLFNWIMTRMIGRDMSGASDYKLIDRQVAEILMNCPERNRFFRGLVAWGRIQGQGLAG
jgi:dolichol-phosphate mannosyltransferase